MTRLQPTVALLLAAAALASTGCITSGKKGISVGQMQPCWLAEPKACKRPIDFTMLRRRPVDYHVIAERDTLGVYVEGILSGEEISSGGRELPRYDLVQDDPDRAVQSPVIGQPVLVQPDGTLHLPLIDPVPVTGLTLQQLADRIRTTYIQAGVLKDDPNKSYVQVSLIKARTNRILVLREDSPATNTELIRRDTYVLSKRGSSQVVTLPENESDLLHALVASGGLPGEDARNEVWILRGGGANWQHAAQQFDAGVQAGKINPMAPGSGYTVIPLRHRCGAALPFTPDDVTLAEGDIIFVEKRIEEVFYTGGVLQAGQIPLPRDEDIDILEAVALANIGVGGPAGINAAASQFRSGPGNVVPPTRALVIRKLPGGDQVKIDVDLRKAVNNAEERILIQPEDFIMVEYRGHELFANIALNFVNVNYVIPND
ncbi:MAG: polysaccharide biosynthesis/export family protein [Planctomycetota bacterium]